MKTIRNFACLACLLAFAVTAGVAWSPTRAATGPSDGQVYPLSIEVDTEVPCKFDQDNQDPPVGTLDAGNLSCTGEPYNC
ncbi:MAG: hypothetical protein GY854_22375 [Deltaproteobacteria bacterium]|nr:hypothetical protein [Deltaproteobacteria bacterium]